MKNADMPAMPQSATGDGYACNYYDYDGSGVPTGLTKREMMAMHIMAGVVSNNSLMTAHTMGVGNTVALADQLLAELDRTSK